MNIVVDELIKDIKTKKNPSCIGIDPDFDKIPKCYKKYENKTDIIYEWACDVIDSIYDVVPCVKPQMAFYEFYGHKGVEVFEKIVKYAHSKKLTVIDDSKRNDIGNTSNAYAYAHLATDGPINADFLTVSPFLGFDSIEPYIEEAVKNGKGVFMLVKTSNPGSTLISDAMSDGDKMENILAKYVHENGERLIGEYGYSSLGAVVGATFPTEALHLRNIMKNNLFLVPGYGAQGGNAEDIVNCFNEDGLGAIVSSSRGVLYSCSDECTKKEYRISVRNAALKMKDSIYGTLKKQCRKMEY